MVLWALCLLVGGGVWGHLPCRVLSQRNLKMLKPPTLQTNGGWKEGMNLVPSPAVPIALCQAWGVGLAQPLRMVQGLDCFRGGGVKWGGGSCFTPETLGVTRAAWRFGGLNLGWILAQRPAFVQVCLMWARTPGLGRPGSAGLEPVRQGSPTSFLSQGTGCPEAWPSCPGVGRRRTWASPC